MNSPSAQAKQAETKGWKHFFHPFAWTRSSYYLMSIFVAVVVLIMVVWWPLVVDYTTYFNPEDPWWVQVDFLLIGIFLVMSILIMAGADLSRDIWIIVVGLAGGLVIEGWGTQTQIWTYYTFERPPLWIIPAWPIASLSIDRLTKIIGLLSNRIHDRIYHWFYWITFTGFYGLMVYYVAPTIQHSMTMMALLTSLLIIISPQDKRFAMNTFIGGSGLGYFLEVWGTTRECWTYYSLETPPLFAIFAHGLAAVAFWKAGKLFGRFLPSGFSN